MIMEEKCKKFILWFDEVGRDDIPLVGGKNANLGEMYQNLTHATSEMFPDEQIQVPFGFAVTAYAYKFFIEKNELNNKISDALASLDTKDMKQLEEIGGKIREMIISSPFPEELDVAIRGAYKQLGEKLQINDSVDVAVRSSAT